MLFFFSFCSCYCYYCSQFVHNCPRVLTLNIYSTQSFGPINKRERKQVGRNLPQFLNISRTIFRLSGRFKKARIHSITRTDLNSWLFLRFILLSYVLARWSVLLCSVLKNIVLKVDRHRKITSQMQQAPFY